MKWALLSVIQTNDSVDDPPWMMNAATPLDNLIHLLINWVPKGLLKWKTNQTAKSNHGMPRHGSPIIFSKFQTSHRQTITATQRWSHLHPKNKKHWVPPKTAKIRLWNGTLYTSLYAQAQKHSLIHIPTNPLTLFSCSRLEKKYFCTIFYWKRVSILFISIPHLYFYHFITCSLIHKRNT